MIHSHLFLFFLLVGNSIASSILSDFGTIDRPYVDESRGDRSVAVRIYYPKEASDLLSQRQLLVFLSSNL